MSRSEELGASPNSKDLSNQAARQNLTIDFDNVPFSLMDFTADFEQIKTALTPRDYGKACYRLGKIYYDKADLLSAEECFLKAMSVAELPRDTFSLFKILGFLIRIASEHVDHQKAGQYIKQADELSVKMTEQMGSLSAECFFNLGLVQNYKGNFKEARHNFELAYRKSKEENEPDLLSKCILALAIGSYHEQKWSEALDLLQQLEQLLKIINKTYLVGAMHFYFGKLYSEMGEYEKALSHLGLANGSLQTKKSWNLFGYILMAKGLVWKAQNHYEKAMTYFEMANESTDKTCFKRLGQLAENEISEVNDNTVDIYLDRSNRKVKERTLGIIDFKHRFVLLEILFLLAKNPGEYFDKEQLAKFVWKDEYNPLIHDKLIYTSVSRLRKLIEPKDHISTKRKYIVRGKDGYTFNPDVKTRFHMENKPQVQKSIGNVDLSSPV